jgi:hypothetical protein
MKKENLILMFFFVVMSIVFLAVLGIQQLIPQTKVDHMFGQKTNIVNTEAVVDGNYKNIVSVSDVVDLAGNKLADIYKVRMVTGYFYMELYVAITEDGLVYAIDDVLEPADPTSESYLPLVRAYLTKYYNGVHRSKVQSIDGAAGATTIQVSRSQIKTSVIQVLNYHGGDAIDYIGDLLGTSYTLGDTTNHSENLIEYDVTAGGNHYRVFKNTGSGTFSAGTVNTGSITVYIAVDDNNIVKFVALPTDLYGHTSGSFYNNTLSYLEKVLDEDITGAIPDSYSQPTANANGSQYLVYQLLTQIKEVVA